MHPTQIDPSLHLTAQPVKRTNIGLLPAEDKEILQTEYATGDYNLAKDILTRIGEVCFTCSNDNNVIAYRIQLAYSDNDL
jgi:hypothetical protein